MFMQRSRDGRILDPSGQNFSEKELNYPSGKISINLKILPVITLEWSRLSSIWGEWKELQLKIRSYKRKTALHVFYWWHLKIMQLHLFSIYIK